MFGVLLLNVREFVWPNWDGYRFYIPPFECIQGLYPHSAFYTVLAVIVGMIIAGFVVKKLRILLYLSGIALSVYTLIPAIIRPTSFCAYPTHLHLFNGATEISVVAFVIMVLLLVISIALTVMQLFKNKHDLTKT
jgi:hypothetical protein